MVRLSRVQQQERTRASLLAAAVDEFTEHGYAYAKIDRIAARAELTRGAVYANFPSKRALYLAVLLGSAVAERAAVSLSAPGRPGDPVDLVAGAEAFARVWLERLPLWGDTAAVGKLTSRSLTGVFDDEPGRAALAGLTGLEGLLLALALESCTVPGAKPRGRAAGARARGTGGRTRAAGARALDPGARALDGSGALDEDGRVRGADGLVPDTGSRVRLARLVLTLLHGASHLAESAPGFGDPFDVALACRQLAEADEGGVWDPPHLAYAVEGQPGHDAWTPPTGLTDLITGRPARLRGNGLLVVLGAARLDAAEEAIRSARPGEPVTLAIVTGDAREIGALVRLRITDFAASLGRVFGPPSLRVVVDDQAAVASAVGAGTADDTEAAFRLASGRITFRAAGRGAGYAAGTYR